MRPMPSLYIDNRNRYKLAKKRRVLYHTCRQSQPRLRPRSAVIKVKANHDQSQRITCRKTHVIGVT